LDGTHPKGAGKGAGDARRGCGARFARSDTAMPVSGRGDARGGPGSGVAGNEEAGKKAVPAAGGAEGHAGAGGVDEEVVRRNGPSAADAFGEFWQEGKRIARGRLASGGEIRRKGVDKT